MAEVVPPQPREELTAIVTDMLIGALAFATALLNDEKAGTYALLTLDVHEAATSARPPARSRGLAASRLAAAQDQPRGPSAMRAPLPGGVRRPAYCGRDISAVQNAPTRVLVRPDGWSALLSLRQEGPLDVARPAAHHALAPRPARSVHRPPKSVGLYSVADANALLEHALSNYVRHHKLYQYAFCVRHIVDLQLAPLPYEVATPVPPLAQALTAEARRRRRRSSRPVSSFGALKRTARTRRSRVSRAAMGSQGGGGGGGGRRGGCAARGGGGCGGGGGA